MRNRSKILLTALTASIVLGALVSTASANRIAISNQFFRATWTNLRFEGNGLGAVNCPVTIEGSFHSRTITKLPELLVGYVTRAIVNETSCTGGSARVLTGNLPWHIRYDSFSGTLPTITGIKLRLILAEFLIQAREPILGFWARCLYRSTVASPMKGVIRVESGVATELTPEAAGIPLFDETLSETACPNPGRLSNASTTLTLLGATTKITVTLVA